MANPPPSSRTRIRANVGAAAQVYVDEMPKIPDEVKERFPSMADYERAMKEWVENLNFRINPK